MRVTTITSWRHFIVQGVLSHQCTVADLKNLCACKRPQSSTADAPDMPQLAKPGELLFTAAAITLVYYYWYCGSSNFTSRFLITVLSACCCGLCSCLPCCKQPAVLTTDVPDCIPEIVIPDEVGSELVNADHVT